MALVDKPIDVAVFAEKTFVEMSAMLINDFLVQLQEGREGTILVVGIAQLDCRLGKGGRHIKYSNRDCCRIIELSKVRLLLRWLGRAKGNVHNFT